MKQKITRTNYFILLFTFVVELILLNIQINNKFSVSIYNDLFKWINVNVVCIVVNIVFILTMIDIACNKKMPSKILNTYKADVNIKVVHTYIYGQIIKAILASFVLRNIIFKNEDYIEIIGVFIITTVIYYVLYWIMPKTDNLQRKLKRIKKLIKTGKTRLNFILIDGDIIPSSFDLENAQEYVTNKDNIYINIKKDLPRIVNGNDNIKELIINNTIAIIHEIDEVEKIPEIYSKQKINNSHIYHIMSLQNMNEPKLPNEVGYIDAIKICEVNSAIEFCENLFSIRKDEFISQRKYQKAMRILNQRKNGNLTKKEMENLDIIYKYNYNNRLKYNPEVVPTDKYVFELYRNAYLNQSPYQSILIFFNYITVIGKLVEYYLFAKNNPKFNKDEIMKDIIGDNPPIWNNHILLNIYKHKENTLYNNLREKKWEISQENKILLQDYLGEILNVKIEGNFITYDGLMQLFINFRNKIEAHGIINDANVYAVWNLTSFFANMLNKMLKISELVCEYEKDSSRIKIGYKDEKKIDVGRYIIMTNNSMCFIKDKKNYINYFSGEIKPSIIEVEKQ